MQLRTELLAPWLCLFATGIGAAHLGCTNDTSAPAPSNVGGRDGSGGNQSTSGSGTTGMGGIASTSAPSSGTVATGGRNSVETTNNVVGGINGSSVATGGKSTATTTAGGGTNGGSSNLRTGNGGNTSTSNASSNGGSAVATTGGATLGSTVTGGSNSSGPVGGGKAAGGSTSSVAAGGSISSGPAGGGKAGGSTSSVAAGGSTHTGTWKIMPFGDSITGTTCYPQLLAQTLKSGAHTNFEFVGTNTNNQSCNGAPALKTEGHGGYLVTYLLTDSPAQSGKGTLTELKQWVTAKPDVVLIHYGTNDVWNNVSADSILSAYVSVMKEFRGQKADIMFFVSKIIPMNPSGCSECGQRVETLNAKITDAWASSNATPASPVYVIDNWTGISTSSDTSDGVHPTPAGAQKMATVTAGALVAKGIP